jgi:hypothetical protein
MPLMMVLQLYLKDNKNPGLIDGFYPEQRFLSPGLQFGELNHVMKDPKQTHILQECTVLMFQHKM